MLKIIVYIVSIYIISDILIYLIFSILKKDFKWLIDEGDENPKFEKRKFEYFLKKSFDRKTGWDRKASTSGYEISNKKTYFKINKSGYRGVKKYKINKYYVFGDSFAFCRYVNDNQTWQFHLSKKNKKNVLNFGVGNFGLDQAFLKYLKMNKKLGSQKVIFCVVPETIARIFSYWKHYREFKNIFAFKPLIKFNKKNLRVIDIPQIKTKSISKNFLKFDPVFLDKLKKKDIFYNLKFKKSIFKFPYSISFLKNFRFNLDIFYYLILNKIFKTMIKSYKGEYYNRAYAAVLKNNIKESHLFYENSYFKKEFLKLINYMDLYFKKKKIKYSIIIVPQYFDLKLSGSNKKYIKFYEKLKNPNVIDLSKEILKLNRWEKYYFIDKYGGHLNRSGNKVLSNILYKKFN